MASIDSKDNKRFTMNIKTTNPEYAIDELEELEERKLVNFNIQFNNSGIICELDLNSIQVDDLPKLRSLRDNLYLKHTYVNFKGDNGAYMYISTHSHYITFFMKETWSFKCSFPINAQIEKLLDYMINELSKVNV
jgi:hypothetical protein